MGGFQHPSVVVVIDREFLDAFIVTDLEKSDLSSSLLPFRLRLTILPLFLLDWCGKSHDDDGGNGDGGDNDLGTFIAGEVANPLVWVDRQHSTIVFSTTTLLGWWFR